MRAVDIVKAIMKEKGMMQAELRDIIHLKQTAMTQRLKQDNISVDKLDEMLHAMNYKIVVVPRNTRMQDDWYEVSVEKTTKKKKSD